MTTCRRFHRVGNDFALCVNIGKKDYVLAENPIDSNTIFYYGIKGIGKLGTMFSEDYVLVKEGEFVDVSGISKGKGFQGVVKRHGFAGVGQATHGQHNRLRAPGSIGAASYPARVFKGMKMGGRMGGNKIKVMNLRVLKVVPEKNLLLLKGCVPGHKNSYLTIEK